ncbi:MAG: type II toxin-antitoxin system VapC family toxin [Gammaproteobacteria bacterium]|nr:MAG: type II toxin-antitoxin system VapC family toxin [Gammaproteobacteria bacterium]
MSRKPKALVLDSWAVLAYLEDESSGQKVADMIGDAHEHGIPLLMSVVNAGEVWYILAREVSETEADKAVDGLRLLGIEFVDADWQLARVAGTFKANNRMSFADCFAAALAKEHKADLVTGDKEFKQIENAVKISWV